MLRIDDVKLTHFQHWTIKSRENPHTNRMIDEKDRVVGPGDDPSDRMDCRLNGIDALAPKTSPLIVPIRSLGSNHRSRIASHLNALGMHDRYLRFGFGANDEQINRYVDGLDFERDEIFGIYNRRVELIAMAHLAFSPRPSPPLGAEFGVSVLQCHRGRRFGERLFERAIMHARNAGVTELHIHALSENAVMLKIARSAGAHVTRDGSESEARLQLPRATLDSHVRAVIEEQWAQADYRIKVQVKQITDAVSGVRHDDLSEAE
jgi:GNAT superfamily N-acetyltransferase